MTLAEIPSINYFIGGMILSNIGIIVLIIRLYGKAMWWASRIDSSVKNTLEKAEHNSKRIGKIEHKQVEHSGEIYHLKQKRRDDKRPN